MIRSLYRHRSGTIVLDLSKDQLLAAAKDNQARVWIDMVSPTPEECRLVFEQVYNFHPLAIEDAIEDSHVPKLDNYGNYLFLVLHTFGIGDERMDIHTKELDVFLGSNFLVTVRVESMPIIEKMWEEAYHRDGHGLSRGAAFLLYELLDRQIDAYIPILDSFEDRLEVLGDIIFRREQYDEDAVLNDILTAKSSALRIRRILEPQRDLMDRLALNDYHAIPSDVRIYYHDIFDHLVRLASLAESTRDLASSTIEAHLAISNNRMNEIMKTLTIISTIFIPLSFIASVYGMNFNMPELGTRFAYPGIWLLFIGVAVVMWLFFRRRKWV